MNEKLFMLILIESQKKAIETYCFGKCGKINFGTIIAVEDLGELLNCSEVDCPFLYKEASEPFGEVDGKDLYLRALKSVENEEL